MKITVLLSSYNGEKYIEEQLHSIITQTHDNISILVRDDGSTDRTVSILKEYEEKGLIRWYGGHNLGCAISFWNLLTNCEESDYYAFCDQDDVWDNDKIEIAVKMLQKEDNNTPLLYFSDVRVTDSELNVISDNMIEAMPISYPHSLIKNIAPGCTYVFNHAARELLKRYDYEEYGIDIHDWTAYRIVACFGKVIFDSKTHMNYRQHNNNVIGAKKRGFFEIVSVVKRFLNKEMVNSREQNAKIMEKCFGELMSAENLRITRLVAHYRENNDIKKELINSGLFKFVGIKYIYFKLLVLLNRI